MGISCKPMGKMKGMFTKIEIEQAKVAHEENRSKKKNVEKK